MVGGVCQWRLAYHVLQITLLVWAHLPFRVAVVDRDHVAPLSCKAVFVVAMPAVLKEQGPL